MAIETLLQFRNNDNTADINARLAGLIPKGILSGGIVIPEPNTLQVRVTGDGVDPWIFLAFASDGMLLRDTADEIVLPVIAGTTNVIAIRAKYVPSGPAIGEVLSMTLGAFAADPDPKSLIRLCSVSPAAGSTAVLPTDIDMTFRDGIEGFTRSVVRGVVDTVSDLPAVSGFPATAEINFLGNTFAAGSTVTVGAGSVRATFPLVPAVTFPLASPANDPAHAGLSRINTSQASIASAVETSLTGVVNVSCTLPAGATLASLGYVNGSQIRVTGNSALTLNGIWTISAVTGTNTFQYIKPGTLTPATGTGGNVVNTTTICTVIARTAPGVLHNLVVTQPIVIAGAIDSSFNVATTVQSVIDSQTFTYTMVGFPTANSGGGEVTAIGISVPADGVQIGSSATQTAANFALSFRASTLASLVQATSIGSSVMLQTVNVGSAGNAYTLAKSEPGVLPADDLIVLSGATFAGGSDPIVGSSPVIDLRAGDLYVVLFGSSGTMEVWGYDGTLFRNLTSSSFGTILDFHRRNLFSNEIHLTDNQAAAIQGTVGVPGPNNRFVTQQDTSVLSADLGAALTGADDVPPSAGNRFLTEARYRGQRSGVAVPDGQDWVQLPPTDLRWVVGNGGPGTAGQFFNVVFTGTLNDPGGPTEYTQRDFTPVTCTNFYNASPFGPSTELDPSNPFLGADPQGIYPQTDAAGLGNPTDLFVQLSDVPDNGPCTVLYSRAAAEKVRQASSDMLAGPQRILPAEIASIQNKVSELRFNTGIGASGTQVYFPPSLFVSVNDQNYTFRRSVSGRVETLTSGFYVDFASGTGTPDVVNFFAPVAFDAAGLWTRYLLTLTQEGKVNVYPLQGWQQYLSDVAYSPTLSDLAPPNTAFTQGEWMFASVAVLSTGTNTIADIDTTTTPSVVELYPYQGGNSRDASAPILVGDGTTSFGHFSGPTAIMLALDIADFGDTIRVLPGTYIGQNLITDMPEVTIEFADGAVLQYQTAVVPNIAFSDWDFSTSTVTVANHRLVQNQPVTLSSSLSNPADPTNPGSLPTGLSANVTYYVIVIDANNFQLAETVNGAPVQFTTGGTGYHTVATDSVFTDASYWDTGTSTITTPTPHNLAGGTAVNVVSVSPPLGILTTATYYVVALSPTSFQLSRTVNGNPVPFTTQGSGTHQVVGELSCLIVDSARCRIRDARFNNCSVGIRITENATETQILNPQFEASVLKKFDGASTALYTNLDFKPANEATWTVTDGFSDQFVGDFNGFSALQQAHDAAVSGDTILVYPGNYQHVTWTKSNLHVSGHGTGSSTLPDRVTAPTGVTVDGQGTQPCISVSGSYNTFENLMCTDAPVGIQCLVGATHNVFASTVTFSDSVVTNLQYPSTQVSGVKHHNFHPLYSGGNQPYLTAAAGKSSRVVTCGDGVSSWGDYVGTLAINQALNFEQPGTTVRVGPGTYAPLTTSIPINDMSLEGSGDTCVIQAVQADGHTYCVNVNGNNNRMSGFHLDVLRPNTPLDFSIAGILVNGNSNAFDRITFTESGNDLVALNRRYVVQSGAKNAMLTRTGGAVGVVSWTVGDGIRSFGDFVGPGAISTALSNLPLTPSGVSGSLSSPSGSTVTFTDSSSPAVIDFINPSSPLYVEALNRYVTLQTGANVGSWKVTGITGATTVTLERLDGGSFTAESGIQWSLVVGAKIVVLPGTYSHFSVPETVNDVDLEAWGAGSDVIVSDSASPLVLVQGSRCRLSGFRLEGTGTGVQVSGRDNTFEKNRFGPLLTSRYEFDASGTGARIHDAPENQDKTAYTVSTIPSRGDFTGTSDAAIQAAINAAAADPQVTRVFIGAGTYTLTQTVSVPQGVTVFGAGYETVVVGNNTFPAFTLASGGNQTLYGMRFASVTNSIEGPATGVFFYGNWGTASCPVAANVTGSQTAMNNP